MIHSACSAAVGEEAHTKIRILLRPNARSIGKFRFDVNQTAGPTHEILKVQMKFDLLQGKILGHPKYRICMCLLQCCTVCGETMEVGWVACPFCGWQQTNLPNPNLSIMEHAQSTYSTNCQSNCGSQTKSLKSKCCKRYKKKSKKGPCQRCPEKETAREHLYSL